MKRTLPVSEAAQLLGVTTKTLQRWEREGRLIPASRSVTNRRLYTEEQIITFRGTRESNEEPTRQVAYCRVSSAGQRSDLVNQRQVLEEFCVARGLSNVEFIEEIGGGLNFRRKRWIEIMDAVSDRKIKTLILAHKDRLTRFGFDWFEHFCQRHGCEIVLLNQERLSPEQELVQDLLTVTHCFSARLYGLRNYRKKLREALQADVPHDSCA